MYVSDAVIQIESDPQYDEGEEKIVRNGCRRICSSYKDDDLLTGLQWSTELCELDIELIEMLTGQRTFDEFGPGTQTIGMQLPSKNTPPTDGVSVEAWSRAYVGTAFSPAPQDYWLWAWPRLKPRLDAHTLDEDFLAVSISADGHENPIIGGVPAGALGTGPNAGVVGGGPNGDWPIDPQVLDGCEGVFLVNGLPTAVCGWIDIPGPGVAVAPAVTNPLLLTATWTACPAGDGQWDLSLIDASTTNDPFFAALDLIITGGAPTDTLMLQLTINGTVYSIGIPVWAVTASSGASGAFSATVDTTAAVNPGSTTTAQIEAWDAAVCALETAGAAAVAGEITVALGFAA
jgi:hypothetical protein